MKIGLGRRLAMVAAIVLSALALSPARADVVVQIDKSSQRMAVSVDGATRYNWPVSTGRSGYGTPSGVFHPQSMARYYFSRKYYNAPMPHAIFFYYGFANSRHQRPRPARRSGLAWLRQAAPLACGGAVRAGPAQRTSQYAHRNQLK
jgi:lipoprotein-anchoring transpeptidase ErfK/SrfK